MCARLLACPLCSQPGFLTLDALRAGLVSVATRPLICPICNEVLLGIDKLTIHLFSHTILSNNTAESSKYVAPNEHLVAVHNAHNVALQHQDWNVLKTQQPDKEQTSNDNSTERLDSGIASTENNISIVNSQPQTQNQSLSVKNANHSFMSDYNYDVIKVNIFPQSNENHNVVLRPTASLQQDVLKTDCAMEFFSNDTIKHLNIITENAQAEKAISDLITGTKVSESINNNIYQDIERECESNNSQSVAKERLISLIEKENNLLNFQSIENIIPVCTNVSSEECNDKPSLSDARETVFETNQAEYQKKDQNSEHRETLSHTCTKVFRTIAPKEKTERCNICGFHFPDTNILTLHKQLVHEQDSNISDKVFKNYSCHLCSKTFKMRGSLMVHMRVAHVGHNLGSLSKDGQIELTCSDTGYTCPTCGKKFKKEQHVIQHLKTHEGKQWECDTCSKMFTTKYFLKKHKRLHSGEMPYKCKICDKSFTFQQSYHKHRFYHKDEKPYNCATCGRSFKELSTLHNHERIHTGEKPFACETCGKCFRQRVSYLVHRRIHTGVMPYKCTSCGKSFRYKVSQRTHKCPVQTSGNTQQSFDTIAQDADDKAIRLQTFQGDQSTMNVIDNDENKFVLIINAQGQHVLALQSEINNVSSERKEENVNADNANKDSTGANNFNSVQLEESMESVKKIQSDNEKIDIKSTNSFFSMVMSPLENSISSTFEIEHLRVSSPKHKEDSIDSYTNFPQVSDSVQMNIVESDIEQSFNRDKDVTDTLQTINEESLKELLYGMDRK